MVIGNIHSNMVIKILFNFGFLIVHIRLNSASFLHFPSLGMISNNNESSKESPN